MKKLQRKLTGTTIINSESSNPCLVDNSLPPKSRQRVTKKTESKKNVSIIERIKEETAPTRTSIESNGGDHLPNGLSIEERLLNAEKMLGDIVKDRTQINKIITKVKRLENNVESTRKAYSELLSHEFTKSNMELNIKAIQENLSQLEESAKSMYPLQLIAKQSVETGNNLDTASRARMIPNKAKLYNRKQ